MTARPLRGMSTGQRHSPVLLNSAYQRWMFWDGRADSLWAQAIQPLESPDEQGSDRAWITRLLLQDPVLLEQYESLFGVLDLQLEELPVHARAHCSLEYFCPPLSL